MNAPEVFQRFMQSALDGMNNDFCIPYMDDVIIYSNSFEDHINYLRKVLQRLREKGVKLKARECKLFKHEVNYLGRIVSPEGYRIDPSNVKAVQELKNSVPKQVGDIRKLLGLLGYYRRYIPDFARGSKPLFELLRCHDKDLNEHKGKEQKGKSQSQVSSRKIILWNLEHQTALEHLIDCLIIPPILAYPQFDQPYVLHTDASKDGLGAILHKRQEGKVRVITYASRMLSPAEKNYHLHSSKLELLALKWAACDYFKDYLYHAPSLVIYTDNNPLTYLLSTAKLN